MGCCGKARANLSVSRAAMGRAVPPASSAGASSAGAASGGVMPAKALAAAGGALQLRYTGPSDVVVRGPLTGKSYAFSQADPVRTVDRRDAETLMRTHYFRAM
jgi:hypothetical protein